MAIVPDESPNGPVYCGAMSFVRCGFHFRAISARLFLSDSYQGFLPKPPKKCSSVGTGIKIDQDADDETTTPS